ncbi:Pyrrolo-quinoline quinone [Rhodococcus wratislaviensis]|uniref:Pyrrolo-quinoline quinone n=1 Tax=Rhodococcus wratislaviensis TaxID=44752 RepID=A0A402CCZ6_RHOWR|nr:PQQ-binding-like beta-propeller repeat protein [Rhodococcus wratislaviensis]GCE41466.1 Pyrrolo-quinoline quinone [Rhodococcus wratislaviensis]
MGLDKSTRNLWAAALVAVVTVAGAVITVIVHEPTPQQEVNIPGLSGFTTNPDPPEASPDAPAAEWSLDAAATYDRRFAVFRNPAYGSGFDSGEPGFVDAGDTLVTMIGLVNQQTSGLDETRLVGVDADTGTVRWHTPVESLGGCADSLAAGRMVCYTTPYEDTPTILAVDTENGSVTRTPTDWTILALTAADDWLYVMEGDPESDDIRVHSGIPTDPDTRWSQRFDVGAAWEDAFGGHLMSTDHGQGVLELGGEVAGFDLASGSPTFTRTLPDCTQSARATEGGVVVRVHSDCSLSKVLGSEAVDRTGRVLAASEVEAVHTLAVDRPTDTTIPVLLGDGAYDRATGELLWTSPDLVSTPRVDTPESYGPNTTQGTAVAVLGEVALLRDYEGKTETALDLRSGERLWHRDSDSYGTVVAADGDTAVTLDSDVLRALDVRSGDELWVLPLQTVIDDDAWDSTPVVAAADTRLVYMTSGSMVGLGSAK